MPDQPFSEGSHQCNTCNTPTRHSFYKPALSAGATRLDAWLEYGVCQSCQTENPLTVHVVIDVEGVSQIKIPSTWEAWQTTHGDDMWFKLFHPHKRELTSKEVETLYGLKPGTARQAHKRGYIQAVKLGHLLLFDAQDARAYWGRGES